MSSSSVLQLDLPKILDNPSMRDEKDGQSSRRYCRTVGIVIDMLVIIDFIDYFIRCVSTSLCVVLFG